MITSFAALIDQFGIGRFADVVGVSYGAAKQMRRRDSVAPEYWPAIIAHCQASGLTEVTADVLLRFAASAQPEAPRRTSARGVAEQRVAFERARLGFITLDEARKTGRTPRMSEEERERWYREMRELGGVGKRLQPITDMSDDEILGYDEMK